VNLQDHGEHTNRPVLGMKRPMSSSFYWDYLTCLSDHPDFASETPYCQEHMVKFSQALAAMRHKPFEPKSTAEAKEFDLRIAEDAALSRLRPIPDGPDQWASGRSSSGTDAGGPGAPLDSDNAPI
jgi:hypothetical protein